MTRPGSSLVAAWVAHFSACLTCRSPIHETATPNTRRHLCSAGVALMDAWLDEGLNDKPPVRPARNDAVGPTAKAERAFAAIDRSKREVVGRAWEDAVRGMRAAGMNVVIVEGEETLRVNVEDMLRVDAASSFNVLPYDAVPMFDPTLDATPSRDRFGVKGGNVIGDFHKLAPAPPPHPSFRTTPNPPGVKERFGMKDGRLHGA